MNVECFSPPAKDSGTYLRKPKLNKETKSETLKQNMTYVISSMQGWRISMEDAHLAEFNITDKVSLFGVFDGHKGKEIAKFCANHFKEELLKSYAFKKKLYGQSLCDTFLKIDEIIQSTESKEELESYLDESIETKAFKSIKCESNAGCTAIVALIVDKELFVANTGDSRCILVSDKIAIPLSDDHKPDSDTEKERIQKAGGLVIGGRIQGKLNLSRALGDFEFKSNLEKRVHEQMMIAVPDIKKKILSNNDNFILLGCDGIWERLSRQEIADFVLEKWKSGKFTKTQVIELLLDHLIAKDKECKKIGFF